MILFPNAKINLGLNVLGVRPDGYHEIETCMVHIPVQDVLEILPNDQFSYQQSGLEVDGSTEENLIVKAFRLIKENYNIPDVYLHLLKNIPMGAGLGGGSADATYTLLALNQLFELNLTVEELRLLAGQLGSDCPFFVENKTQIATGRGEELTPVDINLKGKYLKIVNPAIHIGTAEAYANVDFSVQKSSIREIVQKPVEVWKNHLKNDFEPFAFKTYPILEEIKDFLYAEGAVYASMTGSGSTLYGIYNELPQKEVQDFYTRVVKL